VSVEQCWVGYYGRMRHGALGYWTLHEYSKLCRDESDGA
jgi:hypothetical protein